jgi:hypothetical protein
MAIFGTFAFASGTLVHLFLPETVGRHLPETIAEAIANNAEPLLPNVSSVIQVDIAEDDQMLEEARPLLA